MSHLTSWLLQQAGVQPILANVPDGVEVCRRTGDGKSVLILINHNTQPEHIDLPAPMRELIDHPGTVTSVDLPKFGVAVLQKQ